jgi:hypothetical protein
MSERAYPHKTEKECLDRLEKINDLLRFPDLCDEQDVARLKVIRNKLRRDLQIIDQEEIRKEITAKERKREEDRLTYEYQLLSANKRSTDNMMDLLAKERLENQRLLDSIATHIQKRDDQKLTKLQEKERERDRKQAEDEVLARVKKVRNKFSSFIHAQQFHNHISTKLPNRPTKHLKL